MEREYTIGELARTVGVQPSTVRYYERRGMLKPEARSLANYRIYGPESLQRLRFIRAAQSTGFRLDDIVLLLELRDGTGNPCGEVRNLLGERLQAVGTQLEELQHVQGVLQSALDWCHRSEPEGCCNVLDDLVQRSSE